jgi:hypothetical protein
MTVLGYYVDNDEGVILGAADVLASQIDFDQYVTAKTFKSYRYIGKEGQVYDYSGWEKHYDARSRQVYKHYLGTYVTEDSSTRTDSTDYTHDRGYSPVTTNDSPNFNNESELEERAWYNGGGYRYPEYW